MRHKAGIAHIFIAVAGLVLLSSCAAKQQAAMRLVQPGDALAVNYTCRLADDSSLAATTLGPMAEEETKKSLVFRPREKFGPIDIRVPEASEQAATNPAMGFEETLAIGIANAIAQAPMDRPVHLALSHPGYQGLEDRDRYLEVAAEIVRDRRYTIGFQEFEQRYKDVTPIPGMTVGVDTDFPALIEAIKDETVTLYYSAKPGSLFPTGLGQGVVSEDGDKFRIRLTLQPGELFRAGPLVGKVAKVDEKLITIDFGHPFGGRTLDCEVVAEPLDEALAKMEQKKSVVSWVEDFDQGLALARKESKPVVLVLYADWCKFCHRLFEETTPDARLDDLRSDFVWLKINSDLNPEYGDRFGQEKFPLTVVLDEDGKELARLPGAQDPESMHKELSAVLAGRLKS
ncbi:MAG: thioredoxin fold domain-containing protein [Sulfuricella sp.]|jgi:thioredoxin-related protein